MERSIESNYYYRLLYIKFNLWLEARGKYMNSDYLFLMVHICISLCISFIFRGNWSISKQVWIAVPNHMIHDRPNLEIQVSSYSCYISNYFCFIFGEDFFFSEVWKRYIHVWWKTNIWTWKIYQHIHIHINTYINLLLLSLESYKYMLR